MRSILSAACLQLCSSESIEHNLTRIQQLIQGHKQPIDILLLPENVTLLTHSDTLKKQAIQTESIENILNTFSKIAQEHQLWLITGSLLMPDEHNPNKYYNQCLVFSPDGKLVSHYNKMHLFDVDLGSESWQESTQITAGTQPQSVTLNETWKLGLSICYDLRFPELYREYSKQGCNLLSVPAAFTVPTGKAHWHTLLKARAIENQTYVLAAGQVGTHDDGRKTYGHSCIISPWGEVLAELQSDEGIISAELASKTLSDLKKRMPVLNHRRLL